MNRQILASFQWTVFILAGTIVAPVSVAYAFGFTHIETTTLLQRTFFVMGLTSILQGVFGHRLPLMEGPAGLWWGVFLTFAGIASSAHAGASSILGSLELGMIISGVFFIVLSLFKLLDVVKKLFTPTITGIYLILLVIQLSGPFIKGMFDIQSAGSKINWAVTTGAFVTLILAVIMSRSKVKFFKNYSVLISLIVGWAIFLIFGLSHFSDISTGGLFRLPKLLAWGKPTFNIGVVLTSILTAMLLLTNLIASAEAVERVVEPKEPLRLNRTGFIMGINQALSGLFPTVGGVPISGSAGFILTTGIKERRPFLIGSFIILLISFFPSVMAVFASLPAPVGYATLFVSMASILGIGLQSFRAILGDERKVFIIGIALMVGAGMLLLPQTALKGLPSVVNALLNNGLVIGVLVGIIIEQIQNGLAREKEQQTS